MKLLLIALIVLILERVFDFLFSFSTGYRFYRRSDDGDDDDDDDDDDDEGLMTGAERIRSFRIALGVLENINE